LIGQPLLAGHCRRDVRISVIFADATRRRQPSLAEIQLFSTLDWPLQAEADVSLASRHIAGPLAIGLRLIRHTHWPQCAIE